MASQSNLQRPGSKKSSRFDETPLWNHVTVLEKAAGGGGNRTWTCNYCQRKVVGSYSKVKSHLLKIPLSGIKACPNVTSELLVTLKREENAAEVRKQQEAFQMKQKSAYISLPEGSDLSQQKKRKSNGIEEAFNVVERDTIDKAFARAFYASAVSFNFSRCPYFRKALLMLSNSNVPGYVLPRYDRLRTTLLAQEKNHIAQKLQPIKDTWRRKGVSICSDGWTDLQKKPLINIMAASSGAAMFLKAVNTNGIRKDAEYVASVFLKAMEEVGAQNVVQIVTDNAANYKAAGEIIESKFPHIFWTPCVVHSINLALKSICEPPERSGHYQQCKWILQILNDVQDIRNFIVNHNLALSIFSSHSNLSLLRVAETRFASHLIMARRFKKVHTALQKMVMDVKWQTYREEKNNAIANKARDVKRCIVDDFWWDQLDYILAITDPIIGMLREGDKDNAVLHRIYDMWDTMIEDVKKVIFTHEGEDFLTGKSDLFEVIRHILVSRWNKSNTALDCLAHSLVPKYYSEGWLRGGNNGIMRISPHEDEEVSVNRNKCFRRLFPDPTDLQKVFAEFGAFSTGSGYFNEAHVIDGRMTESSISWWANHGTSTPMLQALAFKLLEQPASSSCTERNWSTYSLIQTVKRNRLETSRTEDLVYVHNNLRVLSRKDDEYVKGPSKFWDICGDNFDPDGDIGEFAQLSLDEPEFEAMIQEEQEDDI